MNTIAQVVAQSLREYHRRHGQHAPPATPEAEASVYCNNNASTPPSRNNRSASSSTPLSRSNSNTSTPLSRRSSGSSSCASAFSSSSYESPPASPSPTVCPPRPKKRRSFKKKSARKKRLRSCYHFDLTNDRVEESQRQTDEDEEVVSPHEQLYNDKQIVRKPVLNELDADLIAPLKSRLFKRCFKKTVNADGTRTLKRNAELNMKLYRRLIRQVLRRLLQGYGYNNSNMLNRFFNASIAIVKKRRANHIQSWRVHSHSKTLIYGWGKTPLSGVREDGYIIRGNRLYRPPNDGKPAAKPSASGVDSDSDPSQMSAYFPDESAPEPSSVSPPTPPAASASTTGTVRCVTCTKEIPLKEAFPKNAQSNWGNKNVVLRCASCWDNHTKTQIDPCEQELETQRATKQKKQKKRTTGGGRKPCRCGSLTHSRTSSLQCPLNKRVRRSVAGEFFV